uniref:rRNA biogenesis protein RRP36 n=1 Tax=Arcella intermedia TaxID=1963864 RepID=A0A6B2LAH0_9EUKA
MLSELPFEERANIRKYDDSYTVYKNDSSFLEKEVKRLREINRQRKRTASMPAEISAKFPVSRKVVVLQPKKKVTRDPRFDSLSGDYHEDLFKKSYQFLYDLQEDEMATLRAQIAKEKNLEQKEKLQRGLGIMEDRKRAEKIKERRRNIIKEHRKEEMAKVAMGKTPYYLKKSDVKDIELKARFKELQDKGQLDNYLKKKRKRIESKEKKKLPFGNPRNS